MKATTHTSSDISLDTPEIRKKIEIFKNYLWKFDKNMDDEIDKEEMLRFFDSNMTDGRLYDRDLADKIFKIFDADRSGKVSVDEFIKTFIHIEEELKTNKSHIKGKYQAEKEKADEIKRKMDEYKGEKPNKNGVCPSGKLTCEIISIDFTEKIDYSSIKIRLLYEDDVQSTREIGREKSSKSIIWNQKFEFKLERISLMTIEVIDMSKKNEEDVIGTVLIELDRFEKQEEYEVKLEIPSDEGGEESGSNVNCRIMVVWSYYELYSELYKKAELNMKTYKDLLEKNSKLLENLNEPFKNFSYTDIVYVNEEMKEKDNSQIRNKVDFKANNNNQSQIKKEVFLDEVIHNQTEKFLKEKMSKSIYFIYLVYLTCNY